MRLVTASVMALLVATPMFAQEPQVQEREREHVVRRGDTLWDLAGRYLANPFRWPVIHEANTRVVADPHWIYPEQVLVIPGLRERAAVAQDATAAAVATVTFQPAAVPARTVFYREPAAPRDGGPTVLLEPLAERVPVNPAEFYGAEFLAPLRGLPVLGRVIRPLRDVDDESELIHSAHPYDELYVSYVAADAPSVGDRLVIAEIGRQVRQAGHDVRMIDPRAVVRVVEVQREVMLVSIEEQFGRVLRGHVALPLAFYPDFLAPTAEPVGGAYDLEGRILAFVDETPLPNRVTRAFIDLGAGHGVQVGDVFEAYIPERVARDRSVATRGERVPAEGMAELRVVRVMDTSATVIVDEITIPQLGPGVPVRRVRKMP